MQKKTGIKTVALALIIFAAISASVAGCRKTPGTHTVETDAPRTNVDIIRKGIEKIDTGKAEEIWAALDSVEPKCVITEVNTDIEQPDGGRYIYVETKSGRRYCINTSMEYELTNISDYDTGERLYVHDPMVE